MLENKYQNKMKEKNRPLLVLDYKLMYFICLLLLTLSLISVALITFFFHWHTTGKCEVWRDIIWLPSITRATSHDVPERLIWQTGVTFHLPRILFDLTYQKLFKDAWRLSPRLREIVCFRALYLVLPWLYGAELFFLASIAYFDRRILFSEHKKALYLFVPTSVFHMTTLSLLLYWTLEYSSELLLEIWAVSRPVLQRSLRMKYMFGPGFLGFILIAFCFYKLYSSFCLPLAYTTFSMLEYTSVLCNIAFNASCFQDVASRNSILLKIGKVKRTKQRNQRKPWIQHFLSRNEQGFQYEPIFEMNLARDLC